jgi:hypothetical protein
MPHGPNGTHQVKKYTIIVEQVGDYWQARFDSYDGKGTVVTGGDSAAAALRAIAVYLDQKNYINGQIDRVVKEHRES